MTDNHKTNKKYGTTEIATHSNYDVIMITRHDHMVSYQHHILTGHGAKILYYGGHLLSWLGWGGANCEVRSGFVDSTMRLKGGGDGGRGQ